MTTRAFRDPLHYRYRSSRPMKTILYLMDRRWWWYAGVYLVFLLKHLPAWAMPFLLGYMINTLAGEEGHSLGNLKVFAAVYAVVLVFNIPLQVTMSSMMSTAIRRMEARLRAALVTRLHHLSFSFLDTAKSGKLQAKILRDVEQVQFMCWHMGQLAPMMVSSIAMAVIYTAVTQPWLLLVFAAMAPMSIGLVRFFRRTMKARNEEFRLRIESMNADVTEHIAMIPVTRAHGVEEAAGRPLEEQFAQVERKGWELDRFNAIFGSSSWVTFQASTAGALLVAFWFAWKGYIRPGDIVIYHSLFGMIVGSVEGIVNTLPVYTKGMESVRSIGEVIECPDLEHNEGRAVVTEVRGDVEFECVGFRYRGGEAPAVADFDLRVAAGETIALVGHSGSGKSTLMSLLIGFRRPTSGRILLDGADMETIDMRTWRRFIGIVPQQPMLFSGTLRENIVHGLEGADGDRIAAAIDMANLREFVDGQPNGLDTVVGEGGATLSGGQRQRVAIARAFVRDPRIILLDEATSALDVVAEKQVQEAIERLARGRTTFIVAHRLSTIRNAHRIVVMEGGRIAETGSREELLRRGGAFHEMLKLQS